MTILTAGFWPALYARLSTSGLGCRRRLLAGRANNRCHWFISMVEEPTKTQTLRVHGALAFFRGASCQFLVVKICKTRDPVKQDRMIDFAITP
jgi:hypothetical protein